MASWCSAVCGCTTEPVHSCSNLTPGIPSCAHSADVGLTTYTSTFYYIGHRCFVLDAWLAAFNTAGSLFFILQQRQHDSRQSVTRKHESPSSMTLHLEPDESLPQLFLTLTISLFVQALLWGSANECILGNCGSYK